MKNYLFGIVKLTKNADRNNYSYSGCGITFDIWGTFSLRNGGFGKNVIIFRADTRSSVNIDNKRKIS